MKTDFKTFKMKAINGGIQFIAFFPNGYGASIVQHSFSYGHEKNLWELAVLKGDEKKWNLTYETPIASDVIGHLSETEVNEIVDKIKALPLETK